MYHTLDQFTDNSVIDALLCWPPREQRIVSIRASAPMFRRPFVEVSLHDGECFIRQLYKARFAADWAEAKVILETLTSILLISEFRLAEHPECEQLVQQVLVEREDSLAGAQMMFEHGMYQQYVWQFGADYKDLPTEAEQQLAYARAQLQQVTADK